MNEENNKDTRLLEEEIQSLKQIIKFLGEDFDESGSHRSINFAKIFKTLWASRILYCKVLPATFVIVALIALSLPNYYTCTVKLSPELSGSKSTSGLASLASSFGINLGSSGVGTEALFPTLYPDLMSSVDFKASLFEVPVTIEGDKEEGEKDRTMSYYTYLKDEQKSPWWSAAISGTMKFIVSLFKNPEPEEDKVDPFRLTKEQTDIVKAINSKVVCDVDKKTMVLTIQVTMQDPNVAATVAKTVNEKLKEYVSKYRTEKAVHDLDYYQKIYDETKAQYLASQSRYARFVDNNQGMVRQSSRVEQTRLQNEASLNYQLFNNAAVQLQNAKAKVQHDTPVFAEIINPTVPLKPSKPSRKMITLVFMVLGFGLGSLITLIKK